MEIPALEFVNVESARMDKGIVELAGRNGETTIHGLVSLGVRCQLTRQALVLPNGVMFAHGCMLSSENMIQSEQSI